MKIKVNGLIWIDEFSYKDIEPLTQYLNDEEVYLSTLNIPHPYTTIDAREWIDFTKFETRELYFPRNFAIRLGEQLIGGIGYSKKDSPVFEHQAEIGYWLAREFWNRGYMTDTVAAMVKWLFAEQDFIKLTANVFDFNFASVQVLLKNGFKEEGLLRKHIKKDNVYFDCRAFGLLKEEY